MYYNTGEAEIDCNMLRSTTCDTSIATFCLVYNHRPDENTLGIQRNAIPLLTFVYITLCPMQNLGSDQKRNYTSPKTIFLNLEIISISNSGLFNLHLSFSS